MIEREPAFKATMRVELEHIKGTVTNPVLVDIGANEGEYTLLMAKYFDGIPCNILAIEPDDGNYKRLCCNVHLSHIEPPVKVDLGNYAISDVDGVCEFYKSHRNNLGSIIYRDDISVTPRESLCLTLKSYVDLQDVCAPSFIKMDIEGGEVLVLRGAQDYLPSINCSILMEVHPARYTDELSLENELIHLFNNGWRCDRVISSAFDTQPEPFKLLTFISQIEVKDGWYRGTYEGDNDFALEYACYPYETGIPDWHGDVSKKLVRAILLKRSS
jgi:FkbM family methyltransferase